jgi:hypothetical protein
VLVGVLDDVDHAKRELTAHYGTEVPIEVEQAEPFVLAPKTDGSPIPPPGR